MRIDSLVPPEMHTAEEYSQHAAAIMQSVIVAGRVVDGFEQGLAGTALLLVSRDGDLLARYRLTRCRWLEKKHEPFGYLFWALHSFYHGRIAHPYGDWLLDTCEEGSRKGAGPSIGSKERTLLMASPERDAHDFISYVLCMDPVNVTQLTEFMAGEIAAEKNRATVFGDALKVAIGAGA